MVRGIAAVTPAVVVAAGLGVCPHPAGASPAADSGVSAPVAAGGSEAASASAAARRSGQRVEIVGLRSQTGQVFADPEGTFTAEEYAQPVRARRADGSWVPVDLTLRRAANGSVAPVASPVDTVLSGGGTGVLVRVSREGHAVSMGWPGRLPAPVLVGDTATYPEVLPGVDLRVRATLGGFAEVLVVKDRAAAANPALRAVRFTTSTRGVSLRRAAAGSLSGVDASGREVFGSGTAMMWDSGSHRAAMPVSVSPGSVTVTPDRDVLAGRDTVFPVYIDPAQTAVGRSNWTMINERHPDQSYWSYDRADGAKVGYTDSTGNSDDYERYRSIFTFPTSTFKGKHVLRSVMSATLTHSWSCSQTRTDLYRVGAVDSGTTWNNHKDTWTDYLHNAWNESCDDQRVYTEWGGDETTELAQDTQTAANTGANITLGLRAHDETTHDEWKKFDPATAKLAVTYNTPPDVPTTMAVEGKVCATGSDRPVVGTATPTFTESVSDPENDVLSNVAFLWTPILADGSYQDPSPYPTAHKIQIATPSSVQFTVDTALADGSYAWRSQTNDGYDQSPNSPWCEFTVDTTRPDQLPAVASADGTYPSDGNYHGNVGRTGAFTLTAGPQGSEVDDVASYLYGLADPPTTEVLASTLGGPATAMVTPEHAGENTLYVRSKDRAGNLSDIAHYRFYVGSPTVPVGWYQADEGAGDTLSDFSNEQQSGGDQPATLSGGVTWTAGRTGGTDHAIALDGSTGYAATAGPVVPTDQSFAVAAWVRLPAIPDHSGTVVSEGRTNDPAFSLRYDKLLNRWVFDVKPGDNALPIRAVSPTAPVAGPWTHLAATYDRATNTTTLYVDGTATAGSYALHGTVSDATGPVNIGRATEQGVGVDYLAGEVDDVRLWDRMVFPGEVRQLVTDSLVGEWKFGDLFSRTAKDSSGKGHVATLTTGASIGFGGHDSGGSLILDGVTGSADTAGPVVRTDQSFTVSAWVKVNDVAAFTSDYRTVVSQSGTTRSAFYLQYSASKKAWAMVAPTADGGTTGYAFATSAAPVVKGWTHLVGVYDAAKHQMKLYVNAGTPSVTSNVTIWNATGAMHLGSAGQSNYVPGGVDDVRVYAVALNDSEIAELYSL